MSKTLRSGYTTGTHATAIFGAVLNEFYNQTALKSIDVDLIDKDTTSIDVKRESSNHYTTIKTDNDDLDVTKRCEIGVQLLQNKPKNLKSQQPSIIKLKNSSFHIYAGDGVGIVTKKGLKIHPTYPAINPVPLDMMKCIASKYIDDSSKIFHIVFSIKGGENIAKQTANAKVGVIGGLSILGTKGIVKPISSLAYIDSIATEISVIDADKKELIVFTLGNTAYDYAKEHYDEIQIVEVGNFIYDSFKLLKNKDIKKAILITGIAKLCKITQGFKNTHNRFGSIDFDKVKNCLDDELNIKLHDTKVLTLKAVLQTLRQEQREAFIGLLCYKGVKVINMWLDDLTTDIEIIGV